MSLKLSDIQCPICGLITEHEHIAIEPKIEMYCNPFYKIEIIRRINDKRF